MDAGCANGLLRNPAGVHQNVTPLTSRRNFAAHVCQLSEKFAGHLCTQKPSHSPADDLSSDS